MAERSTRHTRHQLTWGDSLLACGRLVDGKGGNATFLDKQFLHRMHAVTRRFLGMESLWPPVSEVTVARPMVFFHQRKAGGTSIRLLLDNICNASKLKCYIICHRGISCDTYTLPTKRTSAGAVYAGHIPWGEPQNKFERYWRRPSSNFSCATNYREPVSRVVSCLAHRHGPEMKGNCIEDMDVELLRSLLEKPDAYGTSCLNEPFRIMSGIRSDRFVDTLDVCDEFSQGPEGMVNPHAKLEFALQLTLEHASKCSPLILESMHTYAAASTRFKATPLRFLDGQGMMHHTNSGERNNCSDRQWDKSNLKLVMCKTALERVLYHTVKRKAECALHGLDGQLCIAGHRPWVQTVHGVHDATPLGGGAVLGHAGGLGMSVAADPRAAP